MSDAVAVIGTGQLADIVSEKVSTTMKVLRLGDIRHGIPEAAKCCLVLNDEYRPSELAEAEKKLQQAGMPWLGGFVVFDEGVVGPLVRPGTPGCSLCAEKRRFDAGSGEENNLQLQLDLLTEGVVRRDRSCSRFGLVQMGSMIEAEAQNLLQGKTARTEGCRYLMNLHTLTGSLHKFLPDPMCPVCGSLPDDLPEAARILLEPRMKIDPTAYRIKPKEELADGLILSFRDNRTGLMTKTAMDPLTPFCDVLVRVASTTGSELTAGRSHSYEESERTAMLEGLERYCGMFPRGKNTTVRDSLRNLKEEALDPVSVGLYSEEQYRLPDFPFVPFDEEACLHWVWGYSFLQERPILVPQELAYYSTAAGNRFVAEGSNGCALGGSLEEAIFHGILELAERDSFLLTWYAKLPAPRLDPRSAQDEQLLLMIDRMRAVAGYEVILSNVTTENGIPSIWATAKNRKKTGANLICAAGAHVDPVRAAKSAIFELAAHSAYLDHVFETEREQFLPMLDDPYLVSEMPEHAYLYTLPQAEERLQFVLDRNRPLRSFADEFGAGTPRSDLTEDLKALLQEFRRLKLDVIVVDQTAPEVLRQGLYCVKVIIPGMLPMTFGHHLRRTTGLDRLRRVPMELAYTSRLLADEDLNPHPHPFL